MKLGLRSIGLPQQTATAAPTRCGDRSSINPQTIISAATMRAGRSGSFKMTTAISAPNSTLVSRSAATMAIGATVIAQIAIL